jgi:hypothetical protein
MPSGIPALIMISEFGNAGIAILGRDRLISIDLSSICVRYVFDTSPILRIEQTPQ